MQIPEQTISVLLNCISSHEHWLLLLNLHNDDRKDNHHPTKTTGYPFAGFPIGLKYQAGNGTPKQDLQTTNDRMRLVTMPTLEARTIFREYQVSE
jgi:hypothetical protein